MHVAPPPLRSPPRRSRSNHLELVKAPREEKEENEFLFRKRVEVAQLVSANSF